MFVELATDNTETTSLVGKMIHFKKPWIPAQTWAVFQLVAEL